MVVELLLCSGECPLFPQSYYYRMANVIVVWGGILGCSRFLDMPVSLAFLGGRIEGDYLYCMNFEQVKEKVVNFLGLWTRALSDFHYDLENHRAYISKERGSHMENSQSFTKFKLPVIKGGTHVNLYCKVSQVTLQKWMHINIVMLIKNPSHMVSIPHTALQIPAHDFQDIRFQFSNHSPLFKRGWPSSYWQQLDLCAYENFQWIMSTLTNHRHTCGLSACWHLQMMDGGRDHWPKSVLVELLVQPFPVLIHRVGRGNTDPTPC